MVEEFQRDLVQQNPEVKSPFVGNNAYTRNPRARIPPSQGSFVCPCSTTRTKDWISCTPQFMTHHFPWLQERSHFHFPLEFCPYALFLFPFLSPATGHVSNVFDICSFHWTNPTLYPHLFPMSAPSLQGLLPSSHSITPWCPLWHPHLPAPLPPRSLFHSLRSLLTSYYCDWLVSTSSLDSGLWPSNKDNTGRHVWNLQRGLWLPKVCCQETSIYI